jgi:myo-inositol-1(or 4)-monophosphatase
VAAGIILVREAGGYVTDTDGGEDIFKKGGVVAGNETLHRDLLSVLKNARKG